MLKRQELFKGNWGMRVVDNSSVGLNKGCKTIIISSIGSVQGGNVELTAKENNS